MNFDIQTIAFISSLTFITQFIALSVQYLVGRTYRGVSWWLVGSTLWALGVIFMPTVSIKSLEMLARISNPLTVSGQIFLYIGVVRFLGKKENKWVPISIFILYIFFYYYFIYVYNDISSRGLVLSITLTLVSFMIVYRLLVDKARAFAGSANFTAFVFLVYGIFSAVRILVLLISPPVQVYSDQETILELSFLFPIVASLLWTFGFIIMLNQRLNAEYREEKEKLQMIFNTSPDAAIISRLDDGRIADINAGFLAMSGYTRAELIHNKTNQITIWHNSADREIFFNELKAKGFCENKEFVFQRKNGGLLTGSISAKIITIQAVPHVFSIIHDVTRNKQAEEAVRESEALYRSILNASPDDITITDLKGHILVISPAAKKMFGYEQDYNHFVGSKLFDYIIAEDRERARANIHSMVKDGYSGPNEYQGIRKDGSTFDIEVNSGLIQGANRQPAKMVFIARDITERKQAEAQIQQLIQLLEIEKNTAELNANTDSLTGLANRRYFDDALEKEFNRLKRSGAPLSLIMLDVDHFKKFNDRYGHLAGDNCLRQIGITLKTFIKRATDLAARYGGEEFVVVLAETDQPGAANLAEQIRKAIEALAIPHAESGVSAYVTVSLGVTTVHTALLAAPEQVVALADDALYCAKNEGRNRISYATDPAALPDSNPVE